MKTPTNDGTLAGFDVSVDTRDTFAVYCDEVHPADKVMFTVQADNFGSVWEYILRDALLSAVPTRRVGVCWNVVNGRTQELQQQFHVYHPYDYCN